MELLLHLEELPLVALLQEGKSLPLARALCCNLGHHRCMLGLQGSVRRHQGSVVCHQLCMCGPQSCMLLLHTGGHKGGMRLRLCSGQGRVTLLQTRVQPFLGLLHLLLRAPGPLHGAAAAWPGSCGWPRGACRAYRVCTLVPVLCCAA
jgi:hypothetical protein